MLSIALSKSPWSYHGVEVVREVVQNVIGLDTAKPAEMSFSFPLAWWLFQHGKEAVPIDAGLQKQNTLGRMIEWHSGIEASKMDGTTCMHRKDYLNSSAGIIENPRHDMTILLR